MSVKSLNYDNFTKTDVRTGRTSEMTRMDLIIRIRGLGVELDREKRKSTVLVRHLVLVHASLLLTFTFFVWGLLG